MRNCWPRWDAATKPPLALDYNPDNELHRPRSLLPTDAPQFPELDRVLAGPWSSALDRYLLRTREAASTRSGWRISFSSAGGTGAIVQVEISEGRALYRGEGVFLGWGQESLAEGYRRLLPPADEEPFEPAQLG